MYKVDEYKLLSLLELPNDLKDLSSEQLKDLCDEIRKKIINTVSVNGGHLSPNLGVVELSVALYLSFNFPRDNLVWDVGHQAYTHKILSGRFNRIDTIRTKGGISGFPKRSESEYDSFNVGHSSTSISAAFGLANADALLGKNNKTVAVIGDGALSGGLAYEGLNNAGRFKKNFIVVLNDNKMSISHNVGSMARYLAGMRTRPGYLKTKENMEKLLNHTPLVGNKALSAIKTSKSALRTILYKSTLFEDMGFTYYGPIDGHDIKKMRQAFDTAQKSDRPVLVHVITKKGKGYEFAEKNSTAFHGISKFDVETGEASPGDGSFSGEFGKVLCKLAGEDKRICAITAAMRTGTGLLQFSRKFRDRCFDVGIAEEHAVTFAGALSTGGMIPVFAVYSSFLQRAYDQLIHDVAMQRTKVVLAIDRAGICGEDGETHQGTFDVSMLNSVPNANVFCPSFFDEMEDMFRKAIYSGDGLSAVRYPRGEEPYRPVGYKYNGEAYQILGDEDSTAVVVTYGRLFSHAAAVREVLAEKGIRIKLLKLNRITPIDKEAVKSCLGNKNIFFFEESNLSGSCSQMFLKILNEMDYNGSFRSKTIGDRFVEHASVTALLRDLGLDPDSMEKTIIDEMKHEKKREIRYNSI